MAIDIDVRFDMVIPPAMQQMLDLAKQMKSEAYKLVMVPASCYNSQQSRRVLKVRSSITNEQLEAFKRDWMQLVDGASSPRYLPSFIGSGSIKFHRMNKKIRIPRKLKKRMIGTGSNKILRCSLPIGISSRKFFIQIETKRNGRG